LNLIQVEGTFTGSLSKMYQLDLGYWRFSAAFPVHSEIGRDHNILIENQVCYTSQCEEPPVIKVLLALRGKQFLFIILSPCLEQLWRRHCILAQKKSGEACPCSLQPTSAHHMSAQTFSFITSFEVFPSASTFLLQIPRTFSYESMPSKRGF
jgi:hypothetical protein